MVSADNDRKVTFCQRALNGSRESCGNPCYLMQHIVFRILQADRLIPSQVIIRIFQLVEESEPLQRIRTIRAAMIARTAATGDTNDPGMALETTAYR